MPEITANYDEPWKAAIGEYFAEFLNFFYPEIDEQINWEKPPISLDKELEQITASAETEKRYADKLFQVWLNNDQEIWILIHVEVQSQYDQEFSQRMFIYNYRAFDLYYKPVISLAILGDERPSWRPSSYQYGLGESQVTIQFSTVKLLDYQWESLAQQESIFAIVVMAHLKTKATNSDLSEREQGKWLLVRSLYEKGFNRLEIVNLFKFIDKMMTLSPELQRQFITKLHDYEEEQKMPFLSTMEEMALERGLEQGQAIGQEQGAKATRRQDILALLEKRFNILPESLIQKINKIEDLEILQFLHLETISVNSLEEFEQLIPDV